MTFKEKLFRDPIHDSIRIDEPIILELINTTEFQRLRRIKQLGVTSLTFHGAEHSRFGHSLGVYEITRKIINNFDQNFPKSEYGKDGWDKSERLVTLCAALLHDIGHGPYSHTFEHIFGTDHEAVTVAIITDESTEIHQVLSQISSDFPTKVAQVIQKTYPNRQVVQLISSQIDADRMDYLLRDAFYTGVKYGTFDITWILRVMRPYENGICFDYSGLHAVEDYIISRYQMYLQVYFHPVSRGMEVILDHLLQRAKYLFSQNPDYFFGDAELLKPFFKGEYTLKDYLSLDDGVLNTYFQAWLNKEDIILKDLANRFINRKPFKSVLVKEEDDKEQLSLLTNLIAKMGYNPNYYSAINSASDIPYDVYDVATADYKAQIELCLTDGSLQELSTASDLVAALAGQNQKYTRFYFPRELIKGSTNNLFEKDLLKFREHCRNGRFQY